WDVPEPNVGWKEALGEHAANPAAPARRGDWIVILRPCPDCNGTGAHPATADEPCGLCHGGGKSTEVRAEYQLPTCEQRIKAQFEMWLDRNAKLAIARAEATDGPEEAMRMRSAYVADCAAGLYTWDGRHGRNARGDLPGIRQLLFLLLRRAYPDVTGAQA